MSYLFTNKFKTLNNINMKYVDGMWKLRKPVGVNRTRAITSTNEVRWRRLGFLLLEVNNQQCFRRSFSDDE